MIDLHESEGQQVGEQPIGSSQNSHDQLKLLCAVLVSSTLRKAMPEFVLLGIGRVTGGCMLIALVVGSVRG